MVLEEIETVNGITATVFVFLSILVGVGIIIKYFRFKKRVFLFFGLTWILIVSPWYPIVVSYFSILITGVSLPLEQFLIIETTLVPIGIFVGIAAFTELKYEEKRKFLLLVVGIIGIFMEIIFIYFISTDPTFIGNLKLPLHFEYSSFAKI